MTNLSTALPAAERPADCESRGAGLGELSSSMLGLGYDYAACRQGDRRLGTVCSASRVIQRAEADPGGLD